MVRRLPMDRVNPSTGVRRCAGRIFQLLGDHESLTVEDIECHLGIELRTINRAIDHMGTWTATVVITRERTGRGGTPRRRIALDDGCAAEGIRSIVEGHDASMFAAVALSMEVGA